MRDTEVGTDDPAAESRNESAELARLAVARDPGAWSRIFDLHWSAVYRFVRYRLSGSAEAEDIASQVFEIAYARADRFDYRGVPIEGWLMGIARNLARDQVKKLVRRGPEQELLETMDFAEPDEAGSIDLRGDLVQAMDALTGDQRQVLQLRFLLDKSVADTAVLMDRSEDAVKNLQRRALAAMQRALAGPGYPVGRAG